MFIWQMDYILEPKGLLNDKFFEFTSHTSSKNNFYLIFSLHKTHHYLIYLILRNSKKQCWFRQWCINNRSQHSNAGTPRQNRFLYRTKKNLKRQKIFQNKKSMEKAAIDQILKTIKNISFRQFSHWFFLFILTFRVLCQSVVLPNHFHCFVRNPPMFPEIVSF